MTGTATAFTAEATARLDDYLRQVRAALDGLPDVSADEVEADIRDHVAAEVRGDGRTVTLVRLEAVLAALGPPAVWRPDAPAAGPTFSSKRWLVGVAGTLLRGPEDWRLAYLCFICFVLVVPTGGILLIPAYLLGRAAVELARDMGQPLGARRWLVYPGILAVSVPLLLGLAFAPPVVATIVSADLASDARIYRDVVQSVAADGTVTFRPGVDAEHDWRHWGLNRAGVRDSALDRRAVRVWRISEADRRTHERVLAVMERLPVPPQVQVVAFTAFLALGALLAWWLVVGVGMWAFPAWPVTVFHPLLDGYDWLHGVRLAAVCGIGLAAWAGAAQSIGVLGG